MSKKSKHLSRLPKREVPCRFSEGCPTADCCEEAACAAYVRLILRLQDQHETRFKEFTQRSLE